MKRVISLLLVVLIISTLLISCDFLPDDIKTCKVNFYLDGELISTQTVGRGKTVSAPNSPTKENQIFVGWFVDGLFTYEYDFSSKVLLDTDLHGYFTLDAIAVTNMITTSAMKGLVSIKNKSYNTSMGGLVETTSSTSQGSGVVIEISNGFAYVLTNYHVVNQDEGYAKQKISVFDPWGNEYAATVYKHPRLSNSAMDKSYDLALLYFQYTETEEPLLNAIDMATKNPERGEYVVSLGAPRGQKNSITYGRALAYQKLSAAEGEPVADVVFDIILHNALIDHGSSGGPLLDPTGKLVGINFAGYESNNYGCAIPLSKIVEFLNKYVYVK